MCCFGCVLCRSRVLGFGLASVVLFLSSLLVIAVNNANGGRNLTSDIGARRREDHVEIFNHEVHESHRGTHVRDIKHD